MKNIKKLLTTLVCALLLAGVVIGQPSTRIKLTQLEQSQTVEGTKAGQIGLTNSAGDQRYAQYVEVNLDTIAYTPTQTGNTQNLSEFVFDPTGRIFYIDWQGNSVEFVAGSGSCDVDWLQISDNSCPDALTDSIYKYKYVSIGARNVWPGAELLVNDSTGSGIAVIQGSRNARLALYDSNAGKFLMIDEGGGSPVFYVPVDANLVFKTTGGTPQTPAGSQVNHFAINTQDSTIQAHQYPNTRVDSQTPINFIYTDASGKFRSKPSASFPGIGNGIYGGNGTIPDNTVSTLTDEYNMKYADGDLGLYVNTGSGAYIYSNNNDQDAIQVESNGINMFTQSNGSFAILGDDITIGAPGSLSVQIGASTGLLGQVLTADGVGTSNWVTPSGSGTVTSFSSGNLSPLFTTTVATATTTPALSFTLSNATANTVFAGPTSGGAAAPTFRALVNADIPSAAGGFILDGGNTTGAAITVGTNDANELNLETNNTTRFSLSSGVSIGGIATLNTISSNSTTVENVLNLKCNSTFSPGTGYGAGILLQGESSTTNNRDMGAISAKWTTATDVSRTTAVQFDGVNNAGAIGEFARFEEAYCTCFKNSQRSRNNGDYNL